MRIRPECRVCGESVEYFGDVCDDCELPDDSIVDIERADRFALIEKMEDY